MFWFFFHEDKVFLTLLLAQVKGFTIIFFRVGDSISLTHCFSSVAHHYAKFIIVIFYMFFALITCGAHFNHFNKSGAKLTPATLIHLTTLMWFLVPQFCLSLTHQRLSSFIVDLHSSLTVGEADLKNFINCGHIVWQDFALITSLFLPKLHIELIKQFRMDILNTFGMTKRPLFESHQKIWANLDCPLQKHWLSVVQALFDAIARKQKVQEH